MKVTLTLLVLCIIACVSAQGSLFPSLRGCPATLCAKATELCGSELAANSTTNCGADSFCTSTAKGVCDVPFKLGDTCGTTTRCESGTTCRTSGDNSVCALKALPTSYLYPGEGCNDDKQCQYTSPYGGDDAVDLCRSGNCKSIKTGDYCSPSSSNQCNYNNAYCGRTQQCTKYIKKGGACYLNDETQYGCGKDYDSECIPNGLEGNAGSCQKLHSRKVGDYCTKLDHCKEGLFCRKRNGNDVGQCAESDASPTLNKECPILGCTEDNNEFCTCHTKDRVQRCTPFVRPDGYHGAFKDLMECSRKKGCGSDPSCVSSTGSSSCFNCIKDKCKSQYCKYSKVMKKLPNTDTDCVYEGMCNSAFALVASPVLALFAFVVVFAL